MYYGVKTFVNNKDQLELSFPVDIINWNGKVISLKQDSEIAGQLEILSEAGITHVMLAGLHREEPLAFDLLKESARLGEFISRSGFKISSHHSILPVFAPLTESQQSIREIMAETVRFCAQLKAKTIVFHPGRISGRHENVQSIFAGFKDELNKHGINNIIETAAGNLKYMAEVASPAEMFIALENVGNFEPLANIKTLPELVKTTAMPNLGFCVDSGHAHAFGESVSQWINLAGDKLFETHFHDNHAALAGTFYPPDAFVQSSKNTDEHLFPGKGTIPWDEVIKAIINIKYAGTITFEVNVHQDNDALNNYRTIINWWRKMECNSLSYRGIK